MHHKHPNKFVEKIAQNTSSEVLQSTSKYSRTYPKPQKLHNISIWLELSKAVLETMV